MKTFTEKLNIVVGNSFNTFPDRAVRIDSRRDTNIFATVCLYCADNFINVDDIDSVDFESAVEAIESYRKAQGSIFYFWFDK